PVYPLVGSMICCPDSIHLHNLAEDLQVVIDKVSTHAQPEDAILIDDESVAVQRGFRNGHVEGPMQLS
ncbi:MAG: hypothetical protein ABI988_18225, partial [Nitrospirota bacterium]